MHVFITQCQLGVTKIFLKKGDWLLENKIKLTSTTMKHSKRPNSFKVNLHGKSGVEQDGQKS